MATNTASAQPARVKTPGAMEPIKVQAVPRTNSGKQQATLFDECKAVLSRLGLYRHMAADDHHMDQYKGHSGSTQRKSEDLTHPSKAAAHTLEPSGPSSATPVTECMHSEHTTPNRHSQYGAHDPDNHTTRDQHTQLQMLSSQQAAPPTPPFTGTPPHATRQHNPHRFSNSGDSMASYASMGSWDTTAQHNTADPRTASRSPRTSHPTHPHHHHAAPPHKHSVELQPDRPAAGPNKHPPAAAAGAPTGAASGGHGSSKRPAHQPQPQQVMMYVHASGGGSIEAHELEQHASGALHQVGPGRGGGGGTPFAAVSEGLPPMHVTPPGMAHPGVLAHTAAGLKRLHSQSSRGFVVPGEAAGLGGQQLGEVAEEGAQAHLGLASWKLVSPGQHVAMRRSSRPACVPELNFSVLSSADCDSPYSMRPKALPNLPDALCQCLDPDEEEREELESWTQPARWLPSSEGRHYVFKPVNTTELRRYELLRASLPSHLAAEADRLWNSLIEARYACELMSSRGVRVVKDVTREWSEMSSHLIQRIEAHESAASDMQAYCQQQNVIIQQLTYQLKLAQAAAQPQQAAGWAGHGQSGGGGYGGMGQEGHGGGSQCGVDMAMLHAGAHAMRQPRRADRGGVM